MNPSRHILVWTAVGLGAGCVLSITPAVFLLLVLTVFLIGYVLGICSSRYRASRLVRAVCPLSAVLVIALAAWLPIKPLDRKVGPVNYPAMSVAVLAETLSRDHGLRLDSRQVTDPDRVVTLSTATAVSRAALLDQLAAHAGLNWHCLACGNGATILWGVHPDVIVLENRK